MEEVSVSHYSVEVWKWKCGSGSVMEVKDVQLCVVVGSSSATTNVDSLQLAVMKQILAGKGVVYKKREKKSTLQGILKVVILKEKILKVSGNG